MTRVSCSGQNNKICINKRKSRRDNSYCLDKSSVFCCSTFSSGSYKLLKLVLSSLIR